MSKLNREEILQLAKDCFEDPVLFCKTFLPDLFPGRMPWFQRGLLAILTNQTLFLHKYGELEKILSNFVVVDESYDPITRKTVEKVVKHLFFLDESGTIRLNITQFTVIMMPRGYSKTTVAGVMIPIYNTVFQEIFFTLYVSHSEDHAAMQLDNAKRQLEANDRILQVFGVLRPERSAAERWSSRFYETTTKTAAAARGAGGQVRGLNHLGLRPQLVIVDDLEDAEEVQSETIRDKVKTWFVGDLKPVLPKLDPSARIVVLGTITHPDCLLLNLKRDPQWSTVQLGAIDREGELLWEENMDHRKLEAERLSFALMGKLANYYMEYHSKLISPEAQIFSQDKFQYGIPEERLLALSICMDPAVSTSRTADDTVICVAGVTVKGNKIILDMWGERTGSEDVKLSKYFELVRKWGMVGGLNSRFGVEANAYQASLVNTLKERMFREGLYFEVIPVHHKTKKVGRIKQALLPILNAGYLWFARHFPKLESQLIMLREDDSHEHDDWPDCAAMSIDLLSEFSYLSAPTDLTKDTYEPIEDVLAGGEFEWAH